MPLALAAIADDHDAPGARECAQAMRAVISAVSALKISSERCVGIGDVAQDVVHGAGAGGHLGGDAVAARRIAGPYAATQRKRAGVGERDRIGFICERSDADDRAEDSSVMSRESEGTLLRMTGSHPVSGP